LRQIIVKDNSHGFPEIARHSTPSLIDLIQNMNIDFTTTNRKASGAAWASPTIASAFCPRKIIGGARPAPPGHVARTQRFFTIPASPIIPAARAASGSKSGTTLERGRARIADELEREEDKFKGTLERGLREYHKAVERIKVYTISSFSKQVCGGPHVRRTGELVKFKVTRQESVGHGVRRLRAVLERKIPAL
jgi:hypothetical protein